MSNLFLDTDKQVVLNQHEALYRLLVDYKEAYPDEPYIHEAFLQVMDKIDGLGGEV
jgi:hypothetical protein